MAKKSIIDLVRDLEKLLGGSAPEPEIETARAALDAHLGDEYHVYLLRSECDFRRSELCDFAVFHVPGPDGPSALHPPTVTKACGLYAVDRGLGRLHVIKNRYGTCGPCLQDSIPWSERLKFALVRPVK